MTEGHYDYPPQTSELRGREYLSSPVFLRFAEGWILYQRMLREAQTEKEKKHIRQLMKEIYPNQRLLFKKVRTREKEGNHNAVKDSLFSASENPQNLTPQIISHLAAVAAPETNFLAEAENPAGNEAESFFQVNEFISYSFDGEISISVHCDTMPAVGTSVLLAKTLEGLQEIGRKMKTGEGGLEKIELVTMVSWLLGPDFQDKLDKIFGKDTVHYEDVNPDNTVEGEEVGGRYVALMFNKRALERYLKTGQKPEVRRLDLSREEFLAKFGN